MSYSFLTHILPPDGHCEKVTRDIHISNILGYLGDVLPPLDAEVGDPPALDSNDDLSTVLPGNGGYHALCASLFVIDPYQVLRLCRGLCQLSSPAMFMNAPLQP